MTFMVDGADRLREAAGNIRRLFAPAALTKRAITLAREAGVELKKAVVEQCVEEIYELSGGGHAPFTPRALPGLASALGGEYGGLPEERTEALQRAHILIDEGLIQTVTIDPNAEAEPTPHSGREKVADYAEHVHDGYTQWVPDGRGGSRDTGVHHIGRPWFHNAITRHGDDVCEFVIMAFEQACLQLAEQI